MATEGTKFQVNYKLSDGTLINLYAATTAELETGLADLAMNAANIKATGAEFGGMSPQAAVAAPSVASIADAFNATPVQSAPAPAGASNSCRHGAMSFKSGVSPKGAWQGWMCPTPKGAPDKCETIWIR